MRSIAKTWAKQGKEPPTRKTAAWDVCVKRLEKEHGREICGAYVRSTGWPCEKETRPNGRCRLHGGAQPAPGPLHPNFRHGKYSAAMDGKSLDELYEIAREDPKLLSLKEDIALLTSMQQQTKERMKTGESADAWLTIQRELQYTLTQLPMMGLKDKTLELLHNRLTAMHEITQGVAEDRQQKSEFEERAEVIRKLVDTERKYEEGLRLYLPLDRANAIMNRWLAAIRKHVPMEYINLIRAELTIGTQSIPSLGRDVSGEAAKIQRIQGEDDA